VGSAHPTKFGAAQWRDDFEREDCVPTFKIIPKITNAQNFVCFALSLIAGVIGCSVKRINSYTILDFRFWIKEYLTRHQF
jgi:hypothetical protein